MLTCDGDVCGEGEVDVLIDYGVGEFSYSCSYNLINYYYTFFIVL